MKHGRRLGQRVAHGSLPFGRSHTRRVAPEGIVADACEALLARLAAEAAAELHRVAVGDPGLPENACDRRAPELRIPAGTGEPADVDEGLRSGGDKHRDELVGGPRPMSDGEDRHAVNPIEFEPRR
jgi:hypothetical protein